MANEVVLTIQADSKKAQKSIRGFSKSATKSLKNVQSSFNLLKVAAAGAVAFLGARALIRSVKDLTDAAAVQEDAVNELNIALKASGQFSEEASKDFQDFASELQATTTIGDETTLSIGALIQSLGQLEGEALKGATLAAADLSAALKIDLRAAALLVGKAAAGEISSFSRYGLIIQKGSTNAQTFANTLEAINSQFGGAAAAQVNTFSGAIKQLTNKQGDLNEELGFTITDNPVVIRSIQSITKVYERLTGIINDNRDEIGGFVTEGIQGIFNSIPRAIRALRNLSEAYLALKFVILDTINALVGFGLAILELNVIGDILKGLINLTNDFIKSIKSAFIVPFGAVAAALGIVTLNDELKKVGTNALDAGRALEQSIGESTIADTRASLLSIGKASEASANQSIAAFEKLSETFDKAEKGAKGLADALLTPTAAPAAPAAQDAGGFNLLAAFKAIFDPSNITSVFSDAGEAFATSLGDVFSAEAIGKTLGGAISDGAKAASDLISNGLALAADAFLPGAGALVGPLAAAAQKGPEVAKQQVKLFVTGLVDAIPIIVEALVASLPLLVEKLIDVLLVEGGLERIVVALIQAVPRIAAALVRATLRALGRAGQELVATLRRAITQAVKGISLPALENFLKGFRFESPEWFKSLQSASGLKTPPWVNDLVDLLTTTPPWVRTLASILDFDFSVGGTAGQVLSGIGLQSGGMVPKGFPNDTFPASLTSGELVVPTDTSQQLFELIDQLSGGAGGSDVNSALLARMSDQVSQPIQVSTELRFRDKVLADIVLDLNRRNARLTA